MFVIQNAFCLHCSPGQLQRLGGLSHLPEPPFPVTREEELQYLYDPCNSAQKPRFSPLLLSVQAGDVAQ